MQGSSENGGLVWRKAERGSKKELVYLLQEKEEERENKTILTVNKLLCVLD